MLSIEGLRVEVGGVCVVDDASLWLGAKESLGLVGESGSGKTTMGRAVMGLVRPSAGRILFEGEDVGRMASNSRSGYRKAVQMIFQDTQGSLNPRKRVSDIVAEPLRNFGVSKLEEKRKVGELLELVGLRSDDGARYPSEFSGGQRQRVCIARAVALGPRLIVADEPTSALDILVQARILNFLKDIQEAMGLAYLFISHDLRVVAHMCPRIAVMKKGRIVEQANRDDIFKNPKHQYTQSLIDSIPAIGV